jgi:hypothetical protein
MTSVQRLQPDERGTQRARLAMSFQAGMMTLTPERGAPLVAHLDLFRSRWRARSRARRSFAVRLPMPDFEILSGPDRSNRKCLPARCDACRAGGRPGESAWNASAKSNQSARANSGPGAAQLHKTIGEADAQPRTASSTSRDKPAIAGSRRRRK